LSIGGVDTIQLVKNHTIVGHEALVVLPHFGKGCQDAVGLPHSFISLIGKAAGLKVLGLLQNGLEGSAHVSKQGNHRGGLGKKWVCEQNKNSKNFTKRPLATNLDQLGKAVHALLVLEKVLLLLFHAFLVKEDEAEGKGLEEDVLALRVDVRLVLEQIGTGLSSLLQNVVILQPGIQGGLQGSGERVPVCQEHVELRRSERKKKKKKKKINKVKEKKRKEKMKMKKGKM